MASLRALLATFGLVLLFLVTQQGMQTHWVSHLAPERSQPEKQGSHDTPCQLCAAYAKDGAALPGKSPSFAAAPVHGPDPLRSQADPTTAARFYYSRAPPAFPV